jgi:hypothetical protein
MTEGIARSGFDIDLRDGKAAEKSLAHMLFNSAAGHLIEVKSDELCRKTGNLFIEFKQKGRPSGIATTEAHYWAFQYDKNCWLIVPTERLKGQARNAYAQGLITRGGDFDQYEGVLLPIEWLVKPMKAV